MWGDNVPERGWSSEPCIWGEKIQYPFYLCWKPSPTEYYPDNANWSSSTVTFQPAADRNGKESSDLQPVLQNDAPRWCEPTACSPGAQGRRKTEALSGDKNSNKTWRMRESGRYFWNKLSQAYLLQVLAVIFHIRFTTLSCTPPNDFSFSCLFFHLQPNLPICPEQARMEEHSSFPGYPRLSWWRGWAEDIPGATLHHAALHTTYLLAGFWSDLEGTMVQQRGWACLGGWPQC